MDHSGDHPNPARLFTERYGPVADVSGIARYAEFLRKESGIGDDPPIDLGSIFAYFGIPFPQQAPLSGQSGLLLDPDRGIMIISSNDPRTRQRFSASHELMEMLLAVQTSSPFSDTMEQRSCEEGAAVLLMPGSTFAPYVRQWGVSLDTGGRLANLYDVSLTAALVRAVQLGPSKHALVLWRLGWKPSEEEALPDPNQLLLFDDYVPQPPPQKLRVWWGCSTKGGPFIPRHKSVDFDTSVYQAYESGTAVEGMDWIDLGTVCGHCFCESKTITVDRETLVVSLIHLPRDQHSMSRSISAR